MSTFQYLCRAIAYQQLATPAAAAIFARVSALGNGRFPGPQEVLDLPEERLRSAGLSAAKTRSMRDLARRVTDNELRLGGLSRLPDEEIIARLTTVWGIGEWSAQMYLIFKLGRLDVMPATDLGVREGLRRLDGLNERPPPAFVLERSEPWRPVRSICSWVLWRLSDG